MGLYLVHFVCEALIDNCSDLGRPPVLQFTRDHIGLNLNFKSPNQLAKAKTGLASHPFCSCLTLSQAAGNRLDLR